MKKLSVLFLVAGALFVGACGADSSSGEAPSEKAVRDVVVTMDEYSFVSTDTVFTAGVPYRIEFRNVGQEAHEWAVVPRGATDEENLLFEVEEEDLPAGAVIVEEFVFPEPGEYDFACFLPGHYEAGMFLPIRVVE